MKNSMSRLPFAPVVVESGAPDFVDAPCDCCELGWRRMVPGDTVDDMAAVAVMVTVVTALLVVAPAAPNDGRPKPEKGPDTPAAPTTVVMTLCVP